MEEEDSKIIPAFDTNENLYKYDRSILPQNPVIVIKNNERVLVNNTSKTRVNSNANIAFSNEKFTFEFWDEAFNNLTSKSNRKASMFSINPKIRDTYNNNLQYPRDYIYYNIAPELGQTTGTFSNNFAEYITSFRVNNVAALQNIFDDAYTDWTDFNMEFKVVVALVSNKTNVNQFTKGFTASLSDICDYTVSGNNISVTNLKTFTLPNPIELLPWDMKQYGDTWKLSIYELDAETSSSITVTSSVSSNFGTNYSSNNKEGANFGSSSSYGTNYSVSYNYTIKGSDDYLFDCLIHWQDPILLSVESDSPLPGGPLPISYYIIKEFDTGFVSLTVEPKARY